MPRSRRHPSLDHARTSSELLRHLRGRSSQTAFARWLGYRANVCYSWESGRRHPPASVLFRIAQRRFPLAERLRAFVAPVRVALPEATTRWTKVNTAALLRTLSGQQPASALARALGVDRGSVTRWLSGVTEPRVPELLAFVATTTQRVVDFVDLFVEGHELEELRRARADLAIQRRLAYELPWSHAVLRALELDRYRALREHDDGVIARAIGLSRGEVARLLAELRRSGQIRRRHGRYVIGRIMAVDTRPDPELNRRVKRHWATVALERLERTRTDGTALFSYNLFPVSEQDLATIRELYVEFYERVRHVVSGSRSADRVALLNLALVPLDE